MDRRKRCENRFNRAAEKARVLLAIAAMAPRDVFGELHGYTLSRKPTNPTRPNGGPGSCFKTSTAFFRATKTSARRGSHRM